MPNWITNTITEEQEKILLELCHNVNPINSHNSQIRIGEIGSYTGKSSSIFGNFVKLHGGDFYSIDWFKGSEGTGLTSNIYGLDLFLIYTLNIRELGLDNYIHTMIMTSEEANKIIKDDYFDLFFVDADHRYEGIKRDIDLWLPKVRKEGILCGHDYEAHWTSLTEKEKIYCNNNLDLDLIEFGNGHLHHGIVKAVGEKFKDINTKANLWWIVK